MSKNDKIGLRVRLDNLHSRIFETGDSSTFSTSHFADLCHVFGVILLALPLAVLVALQELQVDRQAVAHSAPPKQLWEQDL